MMKDRVIYKLLDKHKSIIPIIILTSLVMFFLQNSANNHLIYFISWSIILSGFSTYLDFKKMIRWQNKPLLQKTKESCFVIVSSFIVLLIPSALIVFVGLFFIQIYMVAALSETGEQLNPFVRSEMTAFQLSEEEKKSFNARQRLNYPEPDLEMELAIIQNELKIQEITKTKQELEKEINYKESQLQKMKKELENSNESNIVQLKGKINQLKEEKNALIDKRSKILQTKNALEKELSIQKVKLDAQQKKIEILNSEVVDLQKGLKEKDKQLSLEQKKKNELELQQRKLAQNLNEHAKEIDRLKSLMQQLEQEKVTNIKEKDNITLELNKLQVTLKEFEDDKRELSRKYLENEKEIEHLSSVIKRHKKELAQYEKELEMKEIEIESLTNKLSISSKESSELKMKIAEKDRELEENWQLMELIEEENIKLSNERSYYLEKERNLLATIKAHEENLNYLIRKYRYVKINEHETLTRPKISDQEINGKDQLKVRFQSLYPNLSFNEYFFRQLKSVAFRDQIEIERQLMYLSFDSEKLRIKPRRVRIHKRPAVDEIVYGQRASNKIGKGRIYARGKRILALSTDNEEQDRIIAILKLHKLE